MKFSAYWPRAANQTQRPHSFSFSERTIVCLERGCTLHILGSYSRCGPLVWLHLHPLFSQICLSDTCLDIQSITLLGTVRLCNNCTTVLMVILIK